MLSRDLIASVVKTFFEQLEDIRDGGKRQTEAYAVLYQEYFHQNRDWFLEADLEVWMEKLPEEELYRAEMLSELMYRDALEISNQGQQQEVFRKVLALYSFLDRKSGDFSVIRMNRAMKMKKSLGE